jgi:perosamine synthetase
MKIPFFRPNITDADISSVTDCLRSGWLTTGGVTREFEAAFASYVGARHAVAVSSCTAALHLALEAIGLQRGDLVLVPTMTFAATAEVVRYFDATPVFIDCDETTLCIDVAAARRTLEELRRGVSVPGCSPPFGRVRAIIPVHYGGLMADVDGVRRLAEEFDLAVIEDAAHTLPAATRKDAASPWRSVGTTGDITCFSFYANKCITTGEGGMATTDDEARADRMRLMSLHGMSRNAWTRYTDSGSWYYEVVAAGYKYNLTDIASALGRSQLARADALLEARRRVAGWYRTALAKLPGLALPTEDVETKRHSWHLYSVQVDPTVWRQGRNALIEQLKARGIATSVHWQPLHMQPYYRDAYGIAPEALPVAHRVWPKLISLPLYPELTEAEVQYVADALGELRG